MNDDKKPPTVGEIIEALQKYDASMPVLVSTHYDNDIGFSSRVAVATNYATPCEEHFWAMEPSDILTDPAERAFYISAGVIKAVMICAG